MEKYDDDDILDDTKDDLLIVRKYDRFPGYFSKVLNSGDNIVAISHFYIVFGTGLYSDYCYNAHDIAANTIMYQQIPLNTAFMNDDKWVNYCTMFNFYRILGVKIDAWPVSTDSPLSSSSTEEGAIERITYPELWLALQYVQGTAPLYMDIHQMVSSDTAFKVVSSAEEVSKSFVFPTKMYGCADWRQTVLQPTTNFYIYVDGFIRIMTLSPYVLSEAYRFVVTTYINLKDFTGIKVGS